MKSLILGLALVVAGALACAEPTAAPEQGLDDGLSLPALMSGCETTPPPYDDASGVVTCDTQAEIDQAAYAYRSAGYHVEQPDCDDYGCYFHYFELAPGR